MVEHLGILHATTMDCARFLGVDENTFLAFKKRYPEAQMAYDRGKSIGKVSLRRIQMRLAEKSAAMAIFLGKNHLGQSDRFTPSSSGPPFEMVHRLLAKADSRTRALPAHVVDHTENET